MTAFLDDRKRPSPNKSGVPVTNALNEAIPPDQYGVVEPDAHGQAALMLVESLIHTMLEAKSLTLLQAIETVETASEVKIDTARLAGESEKRIFESIELLNKLGDSLKTDQDTPA